MFFDGTEQSCGQLKEWERDKKQMENAQKSH